MSTDADGPFGPSPRSSGFLGDEELAATRSDIVSFVRETVEQAGADGVVVGLSGGVDSTLTAFLAVEALGSERVLGLSMPCHKIDRPDSTEARTIAAALGIEFEEVRMRSLLEQFEDTVEGRPDGQDVSSPGSQAPRNADKHTVGNALARMRMVCLYYAANARSRLVLGTGNRTELLTGYFTKYGDGGADLFPLGDLYKTEVRALARRVGVPHRIVTKPSTAGFWASQTDVDELGAEYEVIDELLHRVIDEAEPVESAVDDLTLQYDDAIAILNRCTDTYHKRRMPPVYRVGDRPPGSDRVTDSVTDDGPAPSDTSGESERSSLDARVEYVTEMMEEYERDVNRDALFRALSDKRRRTVLDILYSRGEATTLPGLVPAVVDQNVDQPPSAITSERFEQVATGLMHIHLPQLAGANLIDYDTEQQTVSLTEFSERLRPVVAPLLA